MSTESRLRRAVRILSIQDLTAEGYWTPCDEHGETVDEKTADHVKCTIDGKIYRWNQHKRIAEHEQKIRSIDVNRMIGADNTETIELKQLIDRLYDVIDRLEKLHKKAG